MSKRIFAAGTNIDESKSRMEIERILKRYGASKFMFGWDDNASMIVFEAYNRRIKFLLPTPTIEEFRETPKGKIRTRKIMEIAHDLETKRRWRALALVIKAKLEAVNSGISTFEQEFMANILLPDGETVGEWISPQLDQIYLNGKMPPLLGSGE